MIAIHDHPFPFGILTLGGVLVELLPVLVPVLVLGGLFILLFEFDLFGLDPELEDDPDEDADEDPELELLCPPVDVEVPPVPP